MEIASNLILGAGLAGLSTSYHLGHQNCIILEKKPHAFGHLATEIVDGFTWDEGPHVSFTGHQYVKDLFERSVGGKLLDYPAVVGNWFHGHWIDHPAQSNLYQAPADVRQEAVNSFLNSRPGEGQSTPDPANYGEWLEQAFGPSFAAAFPRAYTRKYWTVEPEMLGTSWVGGRVFRPDVNDVLNGAEGPLGRQTHYIKTVRYPQRGGFQAFIGGLAEGANLELGSPAVSIDLVSKIVVTKDGRSWKYDNLINTLPLPHFVAICKQSTPEMKTAAALLDCSKLILVNVTAPHPTRRPEHWIYVYDETMLSTRINFTESLSSNNAPPGHTGIQVEVYGSRHKPWSGSESEIKDRVVSELIHMNLIDPDKANQVKAFTRKVDWANVIFTIETPDLLDVIWRGLETYGLEREREDLHPLTNWDNQQIGVKGQLLMAGRFGQWKYFWSDDCLLRGRQIGESKRSS